MPIKILGLTGSLRVKSSSNLILQHAVSLKPSVVEFSMFNNLAGIPAFDDSSIIPSAVENFRQQLKEAGGILICTPEYAFGVPGALKNALDWTVSSGEFYNKPVAVITASTGGEKGHASLLLILSALSAKVKDDATLLISFVRSKLAEDGSVTDPQITRGLRSVWESLIRSAT